MKGDKNSLVFFKYFFNKLRRTCNLVKRDSTALRLSPLCSLSAALQTLNEGLVHSRCVTERMLIKTDNSY